MGPTPITTTHLIIGRYAVAGFQHKVQMYVNASASADPSGFSLENRAGVFNIGVSTIANPLFTLLAPFFTAIDVTFQGVELWHRVGTTYVFVVAVPTTVTPTLGGFFQPATGFDVVGKDSANRNLHFYIYEGPFGISTKITSYAGASANVQALINGLFNVGGTAGATDPYNYRRGRGDKISGRWLAGVIDTNEKLRRIRNIK